MKSIRETLNEEKNRLQLKEGQLIFYKNSGIFGEVVEVTESFVAVDWIMKNGGSARSYYSSCPMEKLPVARELLDNCFLCENAQDKLFLLVKYGK